MSEPPAPTVHLGETIRTRRGELRLSVRTLAARSGFTPSFISQVELGQASPSITSLERIAAALDMTMAQFFDAGPGRRPSVTRAADRPRISSGWSKATIEALAPLGPGFGLEPILITLQPGGSSGRRALQHAVDGFATVLDGQAALTLEQDEHELSRGDSAMIPAGTPHRWQNASRQPVQILMITTRSTR